MFIAQISDLHIRSINQKLYDFIDTNALCARHVAFLNNLKERPDAIVITGDIVNCGQLEEYKMAKRILNMLDYPVYLLPGNHDHNGHLLDTFGKKHPYLGTNPEKIGYVVEDYDVRLIFLDSSVVGQLYGTIGAEKLAWLEETILSAPHRETMVFMHHHPLKTGCVHMDNIRCLDGEQLVTLLHKYPSVKRLVCGHMHRSVFQQAKNLTICIAPSVAHQVPFDTTDPNGFYSLEPPAMMMHRSSEDTGIISYVESLAPYDGPFRFEVSCSCPE